MGRVRPLYPQLFNLAHAVAGSREGAQYCVQCAMLEGWMDERDGSSHHGFRESLRRGVIRHALRCGPQDSDWDGLRAGEEIDPLCALIAQEGVQLRRVLALRYGCGLSTRRIARLCGLENSRVRSLLRRFELRTRRRLPQINPHRLEGRIEQAVRHIMTLPGEYMPDMDAVLRSFHAEAAAAIRPSRLPGRILRAVLAAILALMCIGAFWFAAVLLQPPVLEEPAQIEEGFPGE